MAVTISDSAKTKRFQLRASEQDQRLINVAAQSQGISVTDFILRAAREKAEEALADQTRFVVDEERWNAFLKALDEPAKDKPRLRQLFREKRVAERRS